MIKGTMLTALGFFIMGIGVGFILIAQLPVTSYRMLEEAEIVESGPYENIEALPWEEYTWIHWLVSRTSFNNNGLVILGYDAFETAVREVDYLASQCAATNITGGPLANITYRVIADFDSSEDVMTVYEEDEVIECTVTDTGCGYVTTFCKDMSFLNIKTPGKW